MMVGSLIQDLIQRKCMIAVAESCTGGLLAAALTSIGGSSAVFDRGFVTYSNLSKTEMLGVPMNLIETHGAVSREVAIAMAEGALQKSAAHMTVATTGIAGPKGGSDAKPVGLVHFAVATRGSGTHHIEKRFGALPRSEIQRLAVETAIKLLKQSLPV
jgi:nicotinamide-nucleotide amidase